MLLIKTSKGQLISKANCQAVNSSKKRTNEFDFPTMRLVFICFWKKLKTPKRHFEIKWPLVGHKINDLFYSYFLLFYFCFNNNLIEKLVFEIHNSTISVSGTCSSHQKLQNPTLLAQIGNFLKVYQAIKPLSRSSMMKQILEKSALWVTRNSFRGYQNHPKISKNHLCHNFWPVQHLKMTI